MAQRRLHTNEAERIVRRANELLYTASGSEVGVDQKIHPLAHQSVTTLYLQIHKPAGRNDANADSETQALAEYLSMAERLVAAHCGSSIAEGNNTLLAFFCNSAEAQLAAPPGLTAAVALMDQFAHLNKERLAQDLVPFRIGIGLDTGHLPGKTTNRDRHLAPVLDKQIATAKQLSDLNRQTPFPAIFISKSIVDRLVERNGYTIQDLGDVLVDSHAEAITVYALMHPAGAGSAS